MKSSFFCLLALCFHAIGLRADLGDTPEQATARYGKPTDVDFLLDERIPTERGMVFYQNGIDTFVYFEGGVAVMERHQKREVVKFSQAEVDALLARNGHGAPWTVATSTEIITHYSATLSNGEGQKATWFHGRARGLIVVTEKYDTAREDVLARFRALHAQ